MNASRQGKRASARWVPWAQLLPSGLKELFNSHDLPSHFSFFPSLRRRVCSHTLYLPSLEWCQPPSPSHHPSFRNRKADPIPSTRLPFGLHRSRHQHHHRLLGRLRPKVTEMGSTHRQHLLRSSYDLLVVEEGEGKEEESSSEGGPGRGAGSGGGCEGETGGSMRGHCRGEYRLVREEIGVEGQQRTHEKREGVEKFRAHPSRARLTLPSLALFPVLAADHTWHLSTY
jgi:hypothetical protein